MRWRPLALLILLGLVWLPGPAAAQAFSSGSTGADGPFNPSCSPTPCTVTVTLPPSGVFNFTSITVPANVTVKFTRNAANTPVILLATSSVSLYGVIDVSGSSGGVWGRPGAGGPGGFDGGVGADGVTTTRGSNGLGPGGGGGASGYQGEGGGAGFAAAGGSGSAGTGGTGGLGGPAYGSPAIRPILGGSGGGGGGVTLGSGTGGGGGGGGGALLIASSSGIYFEGYGGAIRANGGYPGTGSTGPGGCGSGGAIRLVAPVLGGSGVGAVEAKALTSCKAAAGRIRLEATTLTFTGSTTPLATTALPQPVFPPSGLPTLAIASVAGVPAPATPSGSFLTAPDIVLPTGTTSPVEVVISASRIPLGTAILVTATPQSSAATTATSTGLAGTVESSTATASLAISLTQANAIGATATFPLVARAGDGPLYADDEEVTHVRVAAALGGGSSVTYLTRSGREVAVR